jgi:2-dehydropantoate 2-reductase
VKVAILGAGALGAVYGVRLARRTETEVAFVVRPSRVSSTRPLVIERARQSGPESLEQPSLTSIVPGDADVILVAVGTADLPAIAPALGSSPAPIVVLTPMMPADYARARAAFGERLLAALPSVIAYARPDGVVRYWLPPVATQIDEPRTEAFRTEIVELTDALGRAGLRARLSLGVHEDNPATTVCFIAIGMAVCIAGSAGALAADDRLVELTGRACREGVRLGDRIGRPEAWARFTPVLAAPWALRGGLSALGKASPEGLVYFETHFGRKLKAQHRVMVEEMIELARERRLPHEAMDELAERLRALM